MAIWGGLKWPSQPFETNDTPRLKPPTQSQMADRNLKVSDLKDYVQNMKLFFIQTLEHFWTIEKWPLQIFLTIFSKKTGINLEWPKMAIPNFFWQFFPIYTSLVGKNSEEPFLAIPNLYQSFWEKLSEKIQNSHFWPFWIYTSLFGKSCQKKFRVAIFGHSEFIPVFLGKIVGKNSEWPVLAILNLYQSFLKKNLERPFLAIPNFSNHFSIHITILECNGLKSNEICTLYISGFLQWNLNKYIHIPFIQRNGLKAMKNSLKKKLSGKTFFQKNLWKLFPKFGNFPKFQSSEMFQSLCEKQFCVLNTNFKIGNFKISVGHLRLGWKFEPGPKWSSFAASAIKARPKRRSATWDRRSFKLRTCYASNKLFTFILSYNYRDICEMKLHLQFDSRKCFITG